MASTYYGHANGHMHLNIIMSFPAIKIIYKGSIFRIIELSW